MALIQVTDLTFSYDGSWDSVFDHVSFQLDTAWRLGLIGRNGRGKTTFLKLLMGQYEYFGSIRSGIPFAMFPCPVPDRDQTVRALSEAISPGAMEWELLRELNLLDLDEDCLDRPFSTLSGGEQTKVQLAAMFLEDRFLLLDEPTNHLDEQTKQTVCRYLKGKRGYILVSHDRWLLDECADHILAINRAGIELQRGNFSTWQENRRRQDDFERAENRKLLGQIDRLTEAAARAGSWSDQVEKSKFATRNSGLRVDRGYVGHKSAKMMKRAKTLEARRADAIEEKSKLLHNVETQEELKLFPLPFHKQRLLNVRDLSIGYGQPLFEGLTFALEQGERIALTGPNGCGKSSLLKRIAGLDVPHTGLCQLASGVTISYVSQDTSDLHGTLSDFARASAIDETIFKTNLRKLDLPAKCFDRDIRDYSAGQKKKVLLARSLSQQANLYLWDEPLNYIDIFSRIQLEEVILKTQPTMIFVEHDRTFREKVATRTIQL